MHLSSTNVTSITSSMRSSGEGAWGNKNGPRHERILRVVPASLMRRWTTRSASAYAELKTTPPKVHPCQPLVPGTQAEGSVLQVDQEAK